MDLKIHEDVQGNVFVKVSSYGCARADQRLVTAVGLRRTWLEVLRQKWMVLGAIRQGSTYRVFGVAIKMLVKTRFPSSRAVPR